MTSGFVRSGCLSALFALAACYDSGSPPVDNPRPARACFYNTSVNRRYFVFQERAHGCAVLWISPVPDGADTGRHFDSTGRFWSAGFSDHPGVLAAQVSCDEAIQQDLLAEGGLALDLTSGRRGWAHVWAVDPTATAPDLLGPIFLSASIDFAATTGGPSETIRILELELTDEETVHECVRE